MAQAGKIEGKTRVRGSAAGVGIERSSNTDPCSEFGSREAKAFEQKVISDGTIDTLKSCWKIIISFTVNEPYDGKMMYYVGVLNGAKMFLTLRESSHFQKGTYLVVSDSSESPGRTKE